ncbi:hypothetical protein B5E84_06275 [Lachnoclostridium sp. An14]|uniref:phenylpyruvate tautomerase MIF-related protein n=1 Tax=Lachnoclostridium sp. An14 TaxID=1965562 RepID=UPI000B3759D7|nr:phenylpyruvate tautomerase MIF-related protein [Lachnoclostridium sp. An14]OUQ19369.1 hypothetical protein B5E84_06275 [Lachnoclostridium sp. An14]
MPFINTKITKTLDREEKDQLTAAINQITSECLGKGENWIMSGWEDGCDLYFKGKQDGAIVYVEVKLFGTPRPEACERMTKQVCDLFKEKLDIPADRVYVSYFATDRWGWNGGNF